MGMVFVTMWGSEDHKADLGCQWGGRREDDTGLVEMRADIPGNVGEGIGRETAPKGGA